MPANTTDRTTHAVVDEPRAREDQVPVKQLLRWQDDGGATIPSADLS